jgi:hypothetical protein
MSTIQSTQVIVSSPYKNLRETPRKKEILNKKRFHSRAQEKNARNGTGTENELA